MNSLALASMPEPVREQFQYWRDLIEPLLSVEKNVMATLQQLALTTGHPFKTIERKFYAARKHGVAALVDRRACGPGPWNSGNKIALSFEDKELVKTYCEKFQRKSMPAVRAMRRDWRDGKITTRSPLDTRTGYPRGWSESNLMRHCPSRYELTVARIGRSAGAAERRLVYTTRANLYVGSHYLFDDMWHDHFVNVLDTQKTGRPLEFHALDLFSANKFAWGMRVRMENLETGKMEGLKEADMRFLLACVLGTHGYSARGTTLVVEHGTAAIRDELAQFLHDETDGIIKVARSGMEGAAAAAHQYAGRSKGNFRFKAALESLGNLIHNEMAALPGQVGMDVDHRPEQMDGPSYGQLTKDGQLKPFGLLAYNDALLSAISQLPPERVQMLTWPLLTIQQFQIIAGEIYARINARTRHEIEGWDLHYIPDRRTGLMRRLSPQEVWSPGARQLTRLRPEAVAMILMRDSGIERLAKSGMVEVQDSEISGNVLRFDASFLSDREKYLTVVNPYQPDALYAYDAKGRFVAACPRIYNADTADVEAVQRACGAAAKAEAERLVPFRKRHMAEAREKARMHKNNREVLSGNAPGTSRLPDASDLASATEHTLERLPDTGLEDAAAEITNLFSNT